MTEWARHAGLLICCFEIETLTMQRSGFLLHFVYSQPQLSLHLFQRITLILTTYYPYPTILPLTTYHPY